MKILFSILLFCFFVYSGIGQGNSSYVIHGKLPDRSLDGSYLILEKAHLFLEKENFFLDSVRVEKGEFIFRGKTKKKPFLAEISCPRKRIGKVIIEPGKINFVRTEWRLNGEVTGTTLNEEYNKYMIEPWNKAIRADSLDEVKNLAVEAGTWTIEDEFHYRETVPYDLFKECKKLKLYFLENYSKYPEVILTPLYEEYSVVVDNNLKNFTDPAEEQVCNILAGLSGRYRKRIYREKQEWEGLVADFIREHPENVPKVQYKEVLPDNIRVGQHYMDFKGITLEGDTTCLSRLVGEKKLVLLDFWASWCGPCMKEMPLIDSLYRNYQASGLEIVGISSDENVEKWQETVKRQNMNWPQLKIIGDDIKEAYCIFFIPYTILIDTQGRMVARNLRGEELWRKVAELLQ